MDRTNLLEAAIEDARTDHEPTSVHMERLMADEIVRLRREAEAKDRDFAYALVMAKLNVIHPIVKMTEEAMERLDGDENPKPRPGAPSWS